MSAVAEVRPAAGIALANVSARGEATSWRLGAMIRNVSLSWDRGVLGVVGAPADGTSALLAVIAGAARARAGVVTVMGHTPDEARAEIAHVPLEPVLPDALRVEEVCALASELRREAPRSDRLASLGLDALAKRRVKSLSHGESRAVALAIALTSSARVLLVEEPLANLEPTAPGRVVEALRARAAAGACVVVTTASVRDATRIADQLAVLTAGTLVPLPPGLAHADGGGARLRVVAPARGVAALIAALADDTAIASVETQAFASRGPDPQSGASSVIVGGRDVLSIASSIGRAAAKARVDVEAIELAVASLDTIRSALAVPRTRPLPSQPPPGSMPPARSAPPPAIARSGPPPSQSPPMEPIPRATGAARSSPPGAPPPGASPQSAPPSSLQRPITPVMPSRPPGSKPPGGST